MNSKNVFVPPSFVCMLAPLEECNTILDEITRDFASRTMANPTIKSVNTNGMLTLANATGCHVASDAERGLTAVLLGELYMDAGPNHAEFVLHRFHNDDNYLAKELNGSFILLIISENEHPVRVITDRVNSRRVFHSFDGRYHWISSSISQHPTNTASANPIGIAHFLASGSMYNFHTPFEGVRVLEQASIHTWNHHGKSSRRYWNLEFGGLVPETDHKKLRQELHEIVVESVRVRLYDNPKSWVSLSGGYDSRLITKLLADEEANVQNFSYKWGEPHSNTDGFRARIWSEQLRQPHLFTNSYQGDLLNSLQRNAACGYGMLNFCGEIDSWFELAELFDTSKRNAVFAGDAVFGFEWDIDIGSAAEALHTVHIHELTVLKRHVSKTTWQTFAECLPAEREAIFNRVPKNVDLITAKDFLYIDQRLPNTLLPWRTIVSNSFAPVRIPLVDNLLLDFIGRVPVSFRRDRRVYLEMIKEFYPQVANFRLPKTNGCIPEWRKEYISFHEPIINWLKTSESKLDAMIPPESIIKLIKELGTWRHHRYSPRTLPTRIVLKTIKGTKMGNRIERKFPVAGLKHLLNRIIPLRASLSKTPILSR